VFKKSDLEKFARDYIISQVPEGKTLLESSFKVAILLIIWTLKTVK